MNAVFRTTRPILSAFCATAVISLAAYSSFAVGADVKVTLSGDQEVPAVKTNATGTGTISVGADKSVSGSVTTTGVAGTMAHIHEGAPGSNGGVAVPLAKNGDNGWSVPAGAKLNDAQYEAFKAGKLYVNVHSAAHPSGEIRGQIKP
jgi:CHRD domain-containing protein